MIQHGDFLISLNHFLMGPDFIESISFVLMSYRVIHGRQLKELAFDNHLNDT